MACRSIALLFSLAVVLCYSTDLPLHGPVSFEAAFTASFGPFNIENPASLTASMYTHPVYVCIVEEQFGLPHWTQYGTDNCLVYFNCTNAQETVALPLLNTKYMVGVWLSSPEAKKGDNTTVHLDLTYTACPAGSFWDSKTCVPVTGAIPTSQWNATLGPVTFVPGETKFWTWDNIYRPGQTTGYFSFHLDASDEGMITAENMIIWARFNGAPSSANHDAADVNGTLTFETPRVGTWVYAVHSAAGGSASFHWSAEPCTHPKAGRGCSVTVEEASNNMTLVAKPGVWQYWRFVATPEQGLLVSVTTGNGSDVPYLRASRGQIPSSQNADIINCNRDFCNIVRSIAHNVTAPEDWYVAVTAFVTSGNQTFGIWFNTSCVTGCEDDNHGECDPSGRCECEIDYEGIDCVIPKGLGPQYIVLIIIASLVVASAIIGFVAWAYMRRKRANYEIVS